MTFKFTNWIEVNINDIITDYNIQKNWLREKIYDTVDDYISGLDDCEYYPLLSKLNSITDEIIKVLNYGK